MSTKPILFNTEMVQAILDGRKTVTRRIIKPQPISKLSYRMGGYMTGMWGYATKDSWKYWQDEEFRLPENITVEELERVWHPPCHAGDILYVRETFDKIPVSPGGNFRFNERYYYKADGDLRPEVWSGKWHPSIHMPKDAARLFLRVKSVRVERLQDITVDGVAAEGIDNEKPCEDTDTMCEYCPLPDEVKGVHCYGGMPVMCEGTHCHKAMEIWQEEFVGEFANLWDSTIKPTDLPTYGYDANPWVWVIEFERCEKPEDSI